MSTALLSGEIKDQIYKIRGTRVMLDSDLARLYELETKALKRSVRRNIERFPSDFMFELTRDEFDVLRLEIEASYMPKSLGIPEARGGDRFLPFVFSEPGVAMLSSVLKTEKAVQINIAIMRAFIQLRKHKKKKIELPQSSQSLESKLDNFTQRFEQFGGRDHSTIFHSFYKIQLGISEDQRLRELVLVLQNTI